MAGYDVVIIGAGISGLSLAYYCGDRGFKTLVLEKSGRTGGAFHSHRFGEEAAGFWLELGAHTCYNSYRNFIDVFEHCGARERLIGREKVPFRMVVDGKIKSIPSMLNFIELFLAAPRIFTAVKKGRSVEAYYSSIVGKKNFDKVFAPAFNAVISQSANDFPADILFKRRQRRKDVIRKYTFDGGIQTVTDSIALRKDIEVRTGVEVVGIGRDGSSFSVSTSEGENVESSAVALATPAAAAARLLTPSFPDVAMLLSKVPVATVESLGVAVERDALSLEPVAGLIPARDGFYSVVSRDTVKHDKYRGFTFHFSPGVMDIDEKLARIGKVLAVGRERLSRHISKENFVPTLRVGHDRLIAEVDGLIAGKRLLLTGNYYEGIAIEDCVSRSRKEFSRLSGLLS